MSSIGFVAGEEDIICLLHFGVHSLPELGESLPKGFRNPRLYPKASRCGQSVKENAGCDRSSLFFKFFFKYYCI